MTQLDDPTRCTHTTADGRRCRMPRVNSHVTLCGTHLEAQQRRLRTNPASTVHDALTGVTDLRSATAINHVLANLASMLVDNRINYRKAEVLANICQLLLQSARMAQHERWDDAPSGTCQNPPLDLPRSEGL